LKIFSDDPNLPYKTTKLKALYTRSEIDGLFAKWGVKDTYWRWDPDNNEVFVQFKIVEKIDDVPRQFSEKVEAPAIWDRKTRSKEESINWDISMRVMFWFIKSHLEAAYLLQSSKTVAFLPYIFTSDDSRTVEDLIPMLNQLQHLHALPKPSVIIDQEPEVS
jgi:hypothetical protein